MVKIKNRGYSIVVQVVKLRKLFPLSKISHRNNRLVWKYTLSPTPLSESYDIKLVYNYGEHPCIYIVNKELELYSGTTRLPHVYNTEKQWLCLYRRSANEWDSKMLIADTIVPWISEWLYYYEFWQATGDWKGRGIHGNNGPYIKEKK
ncbi:MAG: hypothetical protein WBG43_06085 [Marinifilaceae bacterium]